MLTFGDKSRVGSGRGRRVVAAVVAATVGLGITVGLTPMAMAAAPAAAPVAAPCATPPPVGNPAVANPDMFTGPSNSTISGNVLTNDGGTAPLTASSLSPAGAGATLAADGTFTFTPAPGSSGNVTFTYQADNAFGPPSTGTITVTVTVVPPPANRAPTANPDSLTTVQNQVLTFQARDLLSNDVDPDNDPLTIVDFTQPSRGTLTLASDGSYRYAPPAGYTGQDSFTYQVLDGRGGQSAPATVTITITPANQPPTARPDTFTTPEDTTLTIPAGGLVNNDTDPDNDPLTVASVTQPSHGTLTLNGDGSLIYVPSANFNGSDSFTYRADDGRGGQSTTTVSINVTPVNDPPVANPDRYTTGAGSPLVVAARDGIVRNDTDVDGDPLTSAVSSPPSHGSLTLSRDGSFRYVPDTGFSGTDTFAYKANDGTANSNTGTVTIDVSAAPTPVAPVGYVVRPSTTATASFALGGTDTAAAITPAVTSAAPRGADVAAALAVPSGAKAGATVPVTLTVCNNGPAAASGVGSGITLSAGLTVADPGGGAVSRDRRSVGFPTGTLAPGARVVYSITVTVARGATGPQSVNGGILSVRTSDPNYANNGARATITVAR